MTKSVSIIVPTYNEVENIKELLIEIGKNVSSLKEIIVVDDNSPDGTAKEVRRYIKANKINNIRLIQRREKRGLTNSLNEGLSQSVGDVVVWMDADFCHSPGDIKRLLAKIQQGYDIAVGSRFIRGGHDKKLDFSKNDSFIAIFLSRMMNVVIRNVLYPDFFDYTSGFAAARREIFDKIQLQGDYGEYFINFIFQSVKNKYHIVEVPCTFHVREKGASKTGNIFSCFFWGRKYISMIINLSLQLKLKKTLNIIQIV